MKSLDHIFELMDGILLEDAEKTILFCEIEEKAYEMAYYSYFSDGSRKQCYELVDEDRINASVLEKGFDRIARFIRECEEYDQEKRNVITACMEGISEKVKMEQFEKSVGLYKIKKDWKLANL